MYLNKLKNKNALEELFLSSSNERYLKHHILIILNNKNVVKRYSLHCRDASNVEKNATEFINTLNNMPLNVRSSMLSYKKLKSIDYDKSSDELYMESELENANTHFIKEFTLNILSADFVPKVRKSWGYDEYSYKDGVWRPEDLLINCARNARVGYWDSTTVSLPNIDACGQNVQSHVLGNRFRSPVYKTHGSEFPLWQQTARPYQTIVEGTGLDADGHNDRRIQESTGWDLSNLYH